MNYKTEKLVSSKKNRVNLIRGGADYFKTLLDLINNAKEVIHLQVYIFEEDETGIQVADALKAAVKRKVVVYLVVDGYASQKLSKEFIEGLKASGINFRFFEPMWRSKYFYFGRRLHHKVTVVDTRYALVGGINISNRYNDMPDEPAWLDFALRVEGEIAKALCVLCWKAWKGFTEGMGITPCEKKEINFEIPENKGIEIFMRRNDWARSKKEISWTYQRLLLGAEKNITILCSYFLPGKIIRKCLRQAVSKGVKIRVIMAGRSDVVTAKKAERWFYDWMLRNGIELYEVQNTILHGKVATADDKWMTLGSYNVNDLSAFASIELNLDVMDPEFAKLMRETLEGVMKKNCQQILPESYKRSKNLYIQFTNWLSYMVIRVVFNLFTFYYRQHS